MSSDSGGAAGEPVTRADLVRYFHDATLSARRAKGEPAPPRIGIEHELLPVEPRTGEARPFPGERGVEGVVRRLLAQGFEDPDRRDPPVGARRGALAINLEPGAQTEVSGAPQDDLAAVERELRACWDLLREAAAAAGFRYIAHGQQPVSLAHEIPQVPKRRYAYMVAYFEARGGRLFRDMMRRTGSLQASFDFEDEADAGRKLRLALLATPVAAALFANSPFTGGRPNGFLTERTAIWLETDPVRCGDVPAALGGEWSFDRYVDYALAIPAIVVRAPDGGVEPAGGRPFAELLAHGTHGRPVTLADWELHLSTIFTNARLKRVVEARSCDSPPPRGAMSVAAFWTGLLYDGVALEGALSLLAPCARDREELERRVAREALRARVDERTTMLDLARDLVALARAGLARRGLGEERYLAPIEEVAATGTTFAERALARFAKDGIAGLIEDAAI